jgi:putative FmdB family regulatory protein
VPRYSYKCNVCGGVEEIFHRMAETATDCTSCKATESLERIPALFSVSEAKSDREQSTAQQRVDSFISETKRELEEHQRESRKDYEP